MSRLRISEGIQQTMASQLPVTQQARLKGAAVVSADHVAVALVRVDDHFSGVLEDQGEAQGQDAQEGPLPVGSLLLHKVGLGQHSVQLQNGQLLGLFAPGCHYLHTALPNTNEMGVCTCRTKHYHSLLFTVRLHHVLCSVH